MRQRLSLTALLVGDCDEAIDFYACTLGFELREDTRFSEEKRWVVVAPRGSDAGLLLAKAATEAQRAATGAQSGGRVFLLLNSVLASDLPNALRDHLTFMRTFGESARHFPGRLTIRPGASP